MLAADAAKEDNQVTVESADGFQVGELVFVVRNTKFAALKSYGERFKIVGIAANTLTLDGKLSSDYPKLYLDKPIRNSWRAARSRLDAAGDQKPIPKDGDHTKKAVLEIVKGSVRIWEKPTKNLRWC